MEDNFVICCNNGNEEKLRYIINDILSEKNYQEIIKDKIDFYPQFPIPNSQLKALII